MPFLSEIRVVRETAHEDVVYNRASLPFIGDRDYTLLIRYQQVNVGGKDVHLIHYTDANELGPPPRPGVRRVQANAAWWKLEPIAGGERTLATYFLAVERDSIVPRIFERLVTHELMTNTFEVLRRRVRHFDAR